MKVVKLFGVHGSGKTTTGEMLKKYGFEYVKVDPMDGPLVRRVVNFSYRLGFIGSLLRQFMFVYSTYAKLNKLDLSNEKNIVIDFSPAQTIPYTLYFVDNKYSRNFICKFALINEEEIDKKLNSVGYEIYNALFLVYDNNGLKKIKKRILSRKSRPENIRREEARKEYITAINNGMKDMFNLLGQKRIVINASEESHIRLAKLLRKLYEL